MSHRVTGTEEVVFIATKPLQIMICMAIRDQLGLSRRSHLMLVSSFHDAGFVLERIREHDRRWVSVAAFPTRRDAVVGCAGGDYRAVFIDTDVGPQIARELKRLRGCVPGLRLCVYEEGLGTYRDDLCSARGTVLMRVLGASTYFGGLTATDEVWLFRPKLYAGLFPQAAHKTRAIEPSLEAWLRANEGLLESLFLDSPLEHSLPAAPPGGRCVLYLTGWSWHPGLQEIIRSFGGTSILKMHPHIEEEAPELTALFDIVIPARVPAELVVMALARRFADVWVIHHGSSTAGYVNPPNVKYFDVT